MTFLPLVGVGLILALIGWPLSADSETLLIAVSRIVAGVYGAAVWLRWILIEGPHWQSWRGYVFGLGFALIILLSAIFENSIGSLLSGQAEGGQFHTWLIALAALQQILALMSRFSDWIPVFENSFLSRASPGLVLVSTFLLLIGMGTALLKMPNATVDSVSWVDALFTSTSAVCVTGLIVVDTATAFTPLGQGIILLLIQLGAFGFVTLTFFLAVLSGQGFSVSSRVFLGDLLSVENMRTLSTTLITIVGLTVGFEILGAIGLYFLWGPALGGGEGALWDSVFHSISAFCNAGFSTFSDGLADERAVYALDVQAILMALIVLGGIGFPVLLEVIRLLRRMMRPSERHRRGHMITLHTRLVLMLTLLLIGGGALLLWAGGGARSPSDPTGGAWEALFNSITARTAGFNISDMSALPASSTAIMILLMFIGGSPGGIAGGIKTTTFAMAILNLGRILLGRRDVQMFGRRIEDIVTNRAFAVVLISILWVFFATTLILFLQPELTMMDTLFECVSAFATVGLSRGLTGELTGLSKFVIILTMFVGRIGVLNFFFSMLLVKPQPVCLRYPRERIIIE
ncbi:TrkH family potassium uptake protein [Puniceicoccus vermicola]|uniref:TrkH family potassium uptake protein n=1 Tax=Puniceicoccus vermicola TaxID=388746 RepID=UPI00163952A9|nr:potassium transporter TrkG [Puniceicoccus vermicola]